MRLILLFAMVKLVTVSRLEDIAFLACYQEIVSNLLLCPDHHPTMENRVGIFRRSANSYSSLISLNPCFTSKNILQFVRSRLNQHLIGIMNDDVRKKLVQQFNLPDPDGGDKNWDGKCDICPFLDCILDSSFTQIDTHVCSPSSKLNEKLIQTIAKRSPNVEELNLNFTNAESETLGDKLRPFVVSLSLLANLTSLTLYSLKECHRSILKFVGYSCPKLKHISMILNHNYDFELKRQDIIALILGEKLESLPEKETLLNEENDIHHLQISPEYLAPFCSTLQLLALGDFAELEYYRSNLRPTDVAFLIRHIPNLCRLVCFSESVASAVKLLNDIKDDFSEKTNNSPCSVPWITNSPFSGILLLTNMDFVENKDLQMMMRVVGNMCPNLKEVRFLALLGDNIAEEELSFIFTTWPKVERVTFRNFIFSQNLITTALSSIGAQLLHVSFVKCDDINIFDLFCCTQLEVLRLVSSKFKKNDNLIEISPETFLPKLVRLESDRCIGKFSRLFEEKSSLTHLELSCCHVNTTASTMNWNNIVKCWKRIHTLRIGKFFGLKMAMVKSMILRMPKLRELCLPGSMLNSKDEREIAGELMDDFNTRQQLKICLKFKELYFGNCYYCYEFKPPIRPDFSDEYDFNYDYYCYDSKSIPSTYYDTDDDYDFEAW